MLMTSADGGTARPAPLRTNGSNAFAHHSMAVRIPSIIDNVIARNEDYSPAIIDRLRRLRDDIAGDAPMEMFTAPAPDYDEWLIRFHPHEGETWLGTEWFLAEMLSYRLMMEAVGYWATLRDPFAPMKEDELASDALWKVFDEAHQIEAPLKEKLAQTLRYTLWGNRIDLSLSDVAAKGTTARDEHLLSDDAPQAAAHLVEGQPGSVHVIMDNAGTEQAMDFVMADLLLEQHLAQEVVLHVKMHPVLVSDVIVADMHRMLDAMAARGGAAGALSSRIEKQIDRGVVRVVPDLFWNNDGRLRELPPRLFRPFASAALVIAKGDVNYRRATNDALWPAEATLADAVPDFPAPLVVLRTLKSDTLVGVPPDVQARLNTEEPDWRVNGSYGVIQFYGGG